MKRLSVLLLVGALAVALRHAAARSPHGGGGIGAPDLDSARAEVAVGRYWHAARHLRELRAGGLPFGPDETMLLATAEAGYRHWAGVEETLGGADWLEEAADGAGLRLLGRAREGLERWEAAAGAYGRYLATPHGTAAPDRVAVLARRARVLQRAGRGEAALAVLDSLVGASAATASWLALEMAGSSSVAGDTALTRRVVAAISDPEARGRAWELEARAVLAAGDSARALGVYGGLAEEVGSGARRARVAVALAELRLARGDTAGAVPLYRRALDLGPGTGSGVRAARRLVSLDALDPGRALEAARVLDRAGADGAALRAYDLHLASGLETEESVRLARARIMAVTPGREGEAVRAFRELSTSASEEIGATALEAWRALRRRQGRTGDARTLRGWLLERYPGSPQAVEYVFLRGDAAHDRQELDQALADYRRIQEMAPALDQAGLARMRMAQIHLQRADSGRALQEFETYLAAFPAGRRWEEASYWAARILDGAGRREEGVRLLRSILERAPLSYYAVLAARELGAPYGPPVEERGQPVAPPTWLGEELAVVDLLGEAGLEEGRSARVEALTERALEAPRDAALALASALVERDLTLDGINLGWALRRRGAPWSRALLEVIYPLPHREMLVHAARDRGLDPLLVAALVRQESAFDPDIVSSAGAVGLMQVMPATGRQLAAAVGPEDFSPESLVTPEVNLHLGTRYLLDLWERFDGELTLVLSAYNAGPTPADRWRRFPEAGDPLRFTERIPYRETRDYVKLVRRNVALYGALYGDALGS